jgi:hypothetical protein
MKNVVDSKKKEFAESFLKELKGFVNQSSKYDFVKKYPKEWDKFSSKLSTIYERIFIGLLVCSSEKLDSMK